MGGAHHSSTQPSTLLHSFPQLTLLPPPLPPNSNLINMLLDLQRMFPETVKVLNIKSHLERWQLKVDPNAAMGLTYFLQDPRTFKI